MVERRDAVAEIERRIIQGYIDGLNNGEICAKAGVDAGAIEVFGRLSLSLKVGKIVKLVRDGLLDTSGLPQEDVKLLPTQANYVAGILLGEDEDELAGVCRTSSPGDFRKLQRTIYGRLGVVNDLQIVAWRALVLKKEGLNYRLHSDRKTV